MKKLLTFLVMLIFGLTGNPLHAQWFPGSIGTTYNLSAVCISEDNSSIVWAVGYDPSNFMNSTLFKSSDNGLTWTTSSGFPFGFANPTSVYVMDSDNGLVCGVGGIISTTNGGSNWGYLYTSSDTIIIWNIAIGPLGSFWAIGNKVSISTGIGEALVLRSAIASPGSVNLKKMNLPSQYSNYQLTSLCVKDSNNCIISTSTHNPTTMLKTTDGGIIWTEITLQISLDRDIWALVGDDYNNDIMGVGGANGISTVIHSSDLGSTWNIAYDSLNGGRLKSIGSPFGYITDTMYAVGSNGTIVKTTDRGVTWTPQNSGITIDLNSVSMAHHSSKTAIAVGDNGTNLRTTNGGVTSSDNEYFGTQPNTFTLLQNYPNPFNPSTVINYELPQAVYVRLVVYDVLGREVATLVNGGKEAGYRSVEFNAASAGGGLPSGIYTYRMTAGTFVAVKKMLILK